MFILIAALFLLILMSAFFSGSETALMMSNRHRMRHLARQGHGGAKRALSLLQRPDRLIGLILLGNNFVNNLASSIATVIALHLWDESKVALAVAILTILTLIFAEVVPKTLGALRAEQLACAAAYVYQPLLILLYPLVLLINVISNAVLRVIGIPVENSGNTALNKEELRLVVQEAGAMIPARSQDMLLGVLDLDKTVVEDIMVPRNEVYGINLQDSLEDIREAMRSAPYSTLPLYDGGIDSIIGMLHVRDAMHMLFDGSLSKDKLLAISKAPYFIPEGTALYRQLHNFQHTKNRCGLIVDEYGDLLGLVTLSDLLEEVVGEFTTDPADAEALVHPQIGGDILIDCSISVRDLNRHLKWNLPTQGPKTLNGLILEYMEMIPDPGTSLLLHGYPLEVMHTADNAVKTVKYISR